MTIIKKLLYLAVIGLFLFFIIAFIWVRANGKTFIESRASALFKSPVTVEEVEFAFPLGVRLTDLNIAGLLFSPEAHVQFGAAAIFNGSVELKNAALIAPVLTLHISRDNRIVWEPPEFSASESASAVAASSKSGIKAVIRSLTVSGGKIMFPGHGDEEAIDIFLQNVGLTAENVPLSGQPLIAAFELKGTLVGEDIPFSGQVVGASGTVNWPARDMDAIVSVMNDQNKPDLEVRLTSRNNDMMVQGRITSSEVFRSGNTDNPPVSNVLVDAVHASGMGLNMEFAFPTKMDRWELRNIEFSGNLGPSLDSDKR